MPIEAFPDPREATPEGIVAVGGDLHPRSLVLAYRSGIFPWPHPNLPLLWFCPTRRAILEFKDLHVARSLAQADKRLAFDYTVDSGFREVISACASAQRPGQGGTWITPAMREAYLRLHRLGRAHSVEVREEGRLVGGIYGVDADGAFSGESMFYLKPYASKLALLRLIEHLESRGLDWLDIQVMTPHMKAMGAKEIPREEFLEKLSRTRAKGLKLF
ncbi:MAG: leucyl/phenylalanyl-tRNA--protein transferase [Elusimicrobia bacterium]|nr:leucyl/phenylalanyl-tRNA--protein transferase [Elusimicrobiota bacterium]